MSQLSTLLVLPQPIIAEGICRAILADPPESLDDSYDSLGEALVGLDLMSGESFQSQLAMMRRLTLQDDLPNLKIARNSLMEIVWGLRWKWEKSFREALAEKRCRRTKIETRGSFWKWEKNWREPSVASESLEHRPAETIDATADLKKSAVALAQGGRTSQQDRALAFDGILPNGISFSLSIVADGCGPMGDSAAETAVQSFAAKLFEEILFHYQHSLMEAVLVALRFADRQIVEKARDLGGAVFTAYVQVGDEKYIVNVGDSEAWFLSDDGEYTKVTISNSSRDFGRYIPVRLLGWRYPPEEEGAYVLGEPDIFVPTQAMSGLLFLFSDGIDGSIGEQVARAFPHYQLDRMAKEIIQMMSGLKNPERLDNMAVSVRRIG